jgi:hypothetical protein
MAILINDNTARVQYTATSGQTAFVVPFEFFGNSDLKIYRNSTLQTITTQYTVTGAGVTGGGTVTFTSGVTLNDVITIVREIPVKRVTDFPLSGPFNIDALNLQLDQLTAMTQELNTAVSGRVITLTDADQPNVLNPVPVLSQRRNGVFYWDADGQPTIIAAQQLATAVAFGDSISDTFTGTGSLTAFTLTQNPAALNNLYVTVNGLALIPGTDFTWTSGAPLTITFTTAPALAAKILVRYFQSLPQGVLPDGSVSTAKLGVDITAAGKALLDDASASAQRTTLGLGNLAVANTVNNGNWSGTALVVGNGGTGATTAGDARTNLGAAASGVNADITSLVQACAINQTGSIDSTTLGFRGTPQNSQGAAYTLVLADSGKHVSISTGGIRIPGNATGSGPVAFPVGTTIAIYNSSDTSQTIQFVASVTDTLRLAGTSNTGARTLALRGLATLLKVGTTEWVITGSVT